MLNTEKNLNAMDTANITDGPTGKRKQRPRITRRQFLRAGTATLERLPMRQKRLA